MRRREKILAMCLITLVLVASKIMTTRNDLTVPDIPAAANERHQAFAKILGRWIAVTEVRLGQDTPRIFISDPRQDLQFLPNGMVLSAGTTGGTWHFLGPERDRLWLDFADGPLLEARFAVTDATLELLIFDREGGSTLFRYCREVPDLIARTPAVSE